MFYYRFFLYFCLILYRIMKIKIRKLLINVYTIHALLALGVLIILVGIVLIGLNSYTQHGQEVPVPDVKGLKIEVAARFFTEKDLLYAVVDSIYVKNQTPGVILETVPPIGTHVKTGRTIYLTLNAYTARLLTIPPVLDMSQQNASAKLTSTGFENVNIKHIPGLYKDLVVGLEDSRGQKINAGERIPASTSLMLLVNSGDPAVELPENLEFPAENGTDESWY